MAYQSTRDLEAALQWISIAEEAGDLESHCMAVGRSARAVRAFVGDSRVWSGFTALNAKKAGNAPVADNGPDPQALSDLLGDKLADVMNRVGYRPPPEAIKLVRTPQELAKEAQATDIPQATREELVGACRTWLIRLHNRLHQLSQRCDDDTTETRPANDEVYSLLQKAKPPLIGMVAAAEISAEAAPGGQNMQVYAVYSSLDLTVRWLSCLEVE